MAEYLSVEVAFALPHKQELVRLSLPPGSTVQHAIDLSGVLQKYPDVDLKSNKVGIFGKLTRLDAPLRDRDRVEIYRALVADSREIRKRRAEEGKILKKGAEAENQGG